MTGTKEKPTATPKCERWKIMMNHELHLRNCLFSMEWGFFYDVDISMGGNRSQWEG